MLIELANEELKYINSILALSGRWAAVFLYNKKKPITFLKAIGLYIRKSSYRYFPLKIVLKLSRLFASIFTLFIISITLAGFIFCPNNLATPTPTSLL